MALCWMGALLPVSLRAQLFGVSATAVDVGFIGSGSQNRERSIRLFSSDPIFASTKLTLQSSAPWINCTVQPSNSALLVTVSGANFSPANGSYQEFGTITVKSRTNTVKITVSRRNFGSSFASALGQATLALHHPSQPRIYLVQTGRILVIDSQTLDLLDWRLPPAGRLETVRDAYVSRDGTHLVLLYEEYSDTHLLTLDARTLEELTNRQQHLENGPGGRIAEGPDGVIYHSLGALSVFAPDGSLRQRLTTAAPSAGSVARSYRALQVSPDKTELWVQFISGGDLALARFAINAEDGTLTETGVATGLYHGRALVGTPASTPVLFSPDGSTLASHHGVFAPRSNSPLSASAILPEPILGLGLGGRLALTERGLVLLPEGKLIRAFPSATYSRRFLFDPAGTRLIWAGTPSVDQAPTLLDLDLLAESHASLEAESAPADGGAVLASGKLAWRNLHPAEKHQVYLAESAGLLEAETPSSANLLGETNADFFPLPPGLTAGKTRYWRVDTVTNGRVLRGTPRSFRIVNALTKPATLASATVQGAPATVGTISVETSDAATAWTLSSDAPWLAFSPASGIGSANVRMELATESLSTGAHAAKFTLSTAEADVVASVGVDVDPLSITMLRDDPEAARCYAISESPGSDRAHLLAIDATTGAITHAVVAGGSATDFTLHSAERRLYVAHWREGKLRAFASDDLAPAQTYDADFPRPNGYPGDACGDIRRVFAGRAGRLLVETGAPLDGVATLDVLGLLDTGTGTWLDAVYTSNAAPLAVSDPQSGRHYRQGVLSSSASPYSAGRHGIDLQADRLLQNLVSSDYESTLAPTYFVTHEPSFRLYFGDRSYENVFGAERREPDIIVAVSGDERVKIAPHLAYVDGTERRLPPATVRVFNRAAQRVVSAGAQGITITDPFNAPAAQPVTLSATALNDRDISLSWTQPEVALPAGAVVQIDRRVAGDSAWASVYSNLDGTATGTVLGYQSPETAYEFRVRYYQDGIFTPWSEAAGATTGIPRPSIPQGAANPLVLPIALAGESLLVPTIFDGKDITLSVSGLPPGMVYSTDTHTLSGACDTPGRYTILVKATNASGSETRVIYLLVRAQMHDAPKARYTGLLDPDGGPLMGIWSITRSGDKVTGTYRTPLFTRSFKATFGAPSVNYDPLPILEKQAVARISYDGVGISLGMTWDLNFDRISLFASTSNLVDNISADTTPETGRASHWDKTTRPHSDAARYTALLYPGEGAGPDGAGFFTLDLAVDGTAKIGGETALGQKFTQSVPVSDTQELPFFYSSAITLALGEMQLTRELATGASAPRLVGELAWARDANRKSSFYRAGFEQQLLVLGAPLPATGKNLPPLAPLANDAGRADFRLSGGGLNRLSKPIIQSLTPTATGLSAPKAGTPANLNRVSVKLDAKTGLVTGSAAILDADAKKVVRTQSFRGMFVKDPLGDGQDIVGGYFHLPDGKGTNESGLLEIAEPDLPAPAAPAP